MPCSIYRPAQNNAAEYEFPFLLKDFIENLARFPYEPNNIDQFSYYILVDCRKAVAASDPSQAVENTSVNFGRLTNPLGTWSHSAPLDYPANPSFPPGDYYPMGLTSYAGHPGTIGDLGIT